MGRFVAIESWLPRGDDDRSAQNMNAAEVGQVPDCRERRRYFEALYS
jgi:hypothetical protein